MLLGKKKKVSSVVCLRLATEYKIWTKAIRFQGSNEKLFPTLPLGGRARSSAQFSFVVQLTWPVKFCHQLHPLDCWIMSLKRPRKPNFKMLWWLCHVSIEKVSTVKVYVPLYLSFINQYHQNCDLSRASNFSSKFWDWQMDPEVLALCVWEKQAFL